MRTHRILCVNDKMQHALVYKHILPLSFNHALKKLTFVDQFMLFITATVIIQIM